MRFARFAGRAVVADESRFADCRWDTGAPGAKAAERLPLQACSGTTVVVSQCATAGRLARNHLEFWHAVEMPVGRQQSGAYG